MNLSVSNIAWSSEHDEDMYAFLKENGVKGLEIAPTRIFPQNPYDQIEEAERFAKQLETAYGLSIPSMQSIWYGLSENIFQGAEDRRKLTDYTKKAIDFAKAIHCKNLVFGCPKNRNMPDEGCLPLAIDFFKVIGEYAKSHDTVLAVEPNPPIYNTNFLNTTAQAFAFVKAVDCAGIMVNVDLGTMIHNAEDFQIVADNLSLVHHIHISEPYLACIQKRELHARLKELPYRRFFSIEMKNLQDIALVKETIRYVKGILE